MTKRELMATEAMAALIQSMKISDSDSPAEVAELAIKMADALIEGLNQEKNRWKQSKEKHRG
jgi:hypothetical protein